MPRGPAAVHQVLRRQPLLRRARAAVGRAHAQAPPAVGARRLRRREGVPGRGDARRRRAAELVPRVLRRLAHGRHHRHAAGRGRRRRGGQGRARGRDAADHPRVDARRGRRAARVAEDGRDRRGDGPLAARHLGDARRRRGERAHRQVRGRVPALPGRGVGLARGLARARGRRRRARRAAQRAGRVPRARRGLRVQVPRAEQRRLERLEPGPPVPHVRVAARAAGRARGRRAAERGHRALVAGAGADVRVARADLCIARAARGRPARGRRGRERRRPVRRRAARRHAARRRLARALRGAPDALPRLWVGAGHELRVRGGGGQRRRRVGVRPRGRVQDAVAGRRRRRLRGAGERGAPAPGRHVARVLGPRPGVRLLLPPADGAARADGAAGVRRAPQRVERAAAAGPAVRRGRQGRRRVPVPREALPLPQGAAPARAPQAVAAAERDAAAARARGGVPRVRQGPAVPRRAPAVAPPRRLARRAPVPAGAGAQQALQDRVRRRERHRLGRPDEGLVPRAEPRLRGREIWIFFEDAGRRPRAQAERRAGGAARRRLQGPGPLRRQGRLLDPSKRRRFPQRLG